MSNWDPTPWAIGGGADNSAETARTAVWASTNGAEGIVGINDLNVVPFDVPAAASTSRPAGCSLLSRYAGADRQTYTGAPWRRRPVDVANTGSSGGATVSSRSSSTTRRSPATGRRYGGPDHLPVREDGHHPERQRDCHEAAGRPWLLVRHRVRHRTYRAAREQRHDHRRHDYGPGVVCQPAAARGPRCGRLHWWALTRQTLTNTNEYPNGGRRGRSQPKTRGAASRSGVGNSCPHRDDVDRHLSVRRQVPRQRVVCRSRLPRTRTTEDASSRVGLP